MSALEKVLALSGTQAAPAAEEDPVLALSAALEGVRLYLASSDSDDDGDDDSGGKGDSDDDSGHSDHATYKALIKKGVNPKLAAKMCAKSDKKVAASALAESACVILASLTGTDAEPVPEPTYLGRVVALAAKAMGDGGVPMHHGPFNGTHEHSHHLTAAHSHPHQHFGDNNHSGGAQHRQGSTPGQGRMSEY